MRQLTIILVVTILCVSCGKMKDPVFKGIENVKVNEVGMVESTVTLDIRYENPNNFNGMLKQAEGDAWIDSTFLGHFIVDSSVLIPANSEFLVPVKMDVDMKKMLRHSFAALMNEKVLLKIVGTAKAGRSGIYRNFSLNYQGQQNLRELFK